MRISDWSSDVCSSDLDPAVIASLGRLIGTEPLRQVAPASARQHPPERASHSIASKNRRPSLRGPRLPSRPPGTKSRKRSPFSSLRLSPSPPAPTSQFPTSTPTQFEPPKLLLHPHN